MKFSVLGSDRSVLDLANAVARKDGHRIVAAYEADSSDSPLLDAVKRGGKNDSWESLLDGTLADAVIVAQDNGTESRVDQLRKLVQAAVPLILVHPACEAIVGYELDMIRRDTGGVMIPYCHGLSHPALAALARLVRMGDDSPIGAIEQLVFDRSVSDRQHQSVLRQFARDALFIRTILGDVTRLGAMGPGASDQAFSNLSVHMSTSDGILARWSLGPVENGLGGRITLLGPAGKATVEMPDDGQAWRFELPGMEDLAQEAARWDGPQAALDSLEAALAGERVTPDWDDACRAAELADTVQLSLRKGKTVDLYNEEHTEEETFKGMMAAAGCGALMFALLVVLLVAVLDAAHLPLLEHPFWQSWPWYIFYWRHWPYYLCGVLLLFLSLQLLKLVFPRQDRHD